MAVTRASVKPFTCTNPNLVRVGTLPPSITGAALFFTAEMSPIGSVASASVPNFGTTETALVFTAAGGTQAVTEGGRRFWRFNGGAANVSSNVNPAVHTRFLRVRVRETLTATNKVLLGNSTTGGPTILANSSRFSMNGGKQVDGPAIAPGNVWHTVITVHAGADSLIEVDGAVVEGDSGTAARNGFRVAASGATPYEFATIDVQAVGLMPGAATAAQRAEIRAALEF